MPFFSVQLIKVLFDSEKNLERHLGNVAVDQAMRACEIIIEEETLPHIVMFGDPSGAWDYKKHSISPVTEKAELEQESQNLEMVFGEPPFVFISRASVNRHERQRFGFVMSDIRVLSSVIFVRLFVCSHEEYYRMD